MRLPNYVVVAISNSHAEPILRTPAKSFIFPLSNEEKHDINILEAKFDQEENIAGLAAPQIGIGKRAIVFAVNSDQDIKKIRKDLIQTMPKSIWLNPSYKPVTNEKSKDYEACFSVQDVSGFVERYTKVHYTAYDIDGTMINGEAEGFLARVIQHEIDHLDGKLFIDYVNPSELITIEQYKELRKKAIIETSA